MLKKNTYSLLIKNATFYDIHLLKFLYKQFCEFKDIYLTQFIVIYRIFDNVYSIGERDSEISFGFIMEFNSFEHCTEFYSWLKNAADLTNGNNDLNQYNRQFEFIDSPMVFSELVGELVGIIFNNDIQLDDFMLDNLQQTKDELFNYISNNNASDVLVHMIYEIMLVNFWIAFYRKNISQLLDVSA